jgi:XisH protein
MKISFFSVLLTMPAKDLYHGSVRSALLKDHWIVTHDPLALRYGKKDLFIDLGAEQFIAAEKQGRKIAIEIKSFMGRSEVEDLRNALGQYVLYQNVLEIKEPDRQLYLAVPTQAFTEIFTEDLGKLILTKNLMKVMIFDIDREEIVRWID